MSKDIVKRGVGRPTKMTDDVVNKLESILKVGGTIEEACAYAKISKMSYYKWLEDSNDFLTKMESAKHYADIVAKNVVVDEIVNKKDLATAKWWLEKREFRDKGNNQQVNVMMPVFNVMTDEAKEQLEKLYDKGLDSSNN